MFYDSLADDIKKSYMDFGQSPTNFFHLYAYCKGLEFVIENLGKLGELAIKESQKDATGG